ncbi:MAG: chromosomal replication initiator protein DnaA [Gemmatimonadetes bacterium]|nr:chromosomal replication initiator protein DnaA [Gemmatimonadota bacterium]
MEFTATDLWDRVLAAVRPSMPEQSYKAWLSATRAVALSDSALEVEASSEFHAEWIEDKYGSVLEELTQSLVGRPILLTIKAGDGAHPVFPAVEVVPPDLPEHAPPAPSQPILQRSPGGHSPRGPHSPGGHDQRRARVRPALNDRYTFERFVVGSNNQLASAACHAVADQPARMYNPLFLYGGVGLGKTHLMHAIGNHLLSESDGADILYITTEQFVNDLVTSIREGKTREFRQRYRKVDLLLVDDVHFMKEKEGTQEEFFHTFNALYDARKQIILTSDRPPKEIKGLENRLVSRFEWGLVVDIKPPDWETRVAILRKKAEDDGLVLDPEVIDFIARSCTASVRELEGAVIKLLAYSSLTHQEITVELARTALSGMIGSTMGDEPQLPSSLTPEVVRERVASAWNVTPDGLASKRRTKNLTEPRQVAMYLIREMLDTPLVAIGEVFGGRDHSTVIHSIRKVENTLASDVAFARRVESIREGLRDGPRGRG